MDRIIKFRSWNVDEKIMHDIAMPTWNGSHEVWKNNIPQSEIQYLSNGPVDEGVLMQFSGLKDKNGKEIFEGDILSVDEHIDRVGGKWTKQITTVTFEHGCFVHRSNRGFYDKVGHSISFVEIIGNIYENPDLLK